MHLLKNHMEKIVLQFHSPQHRHLMISISLWRQYVHYQSHCSYILGSSNKIVVSRKMSSYITCFYTPHSLVSNTSAMQALFENIPIYFAPIERTCESMSTRLNPCPLRIKKVSPIKSPQHCSTTLKNCHRCGTPLFNRCAIRCELSWTSIYPGFLGQHNFSAYMLHSGLNIDRAKI